MPDSPFLREEFEYCPKAVQSINTEFRCVQKCEDRWPVCTLNVILWTLWTKPSFSFLTFSGSNRAHIYTRLCIFYSSVHTVTVLRSSPESLTLVQYMCVWTGLSSCTGCEADWRECHGRLSVVRSLTSCRCERERERQMSWFYTKNMFIIILLTMLYSRVTV